MVIRDEQATLPHEHEKRREALNYPDLATSSAAPDGYFPTATPAATILPRHCLSPPAPDLSPKSDINDPKQSRSHMLSVKTESATQLPFDENPLRAISRGKQRRLLKHQHAANTAVLPRVLLPPQIAMARTPSRQRLPTRPSPVGGPSPVKPARPDPATDSKTSRRKGLLTRDSIDSGRSS